MAVGQNYGFDNLKQLDLRSSKRFRLDSYRFRVDFDAYNLFNSDWPFTRQQHVLDRGDQQLAAADQRAAGAVLQDRRAVRFLISDCSDFGFGRWGFGSTALFRFGTLNSP